MRVRRNHWGAYASLLSLTGACLAAGCSDQAAFDSDEIREQGEGVIIGSNDLIKVQAGGSNLPAKYQSFVNAFGRLHMGSGLCTATHLGNGIAISAGHCWDAGASRQNNTSCSGDYVEWGYINGSTASRSDCTTVLAKQQSSGTSRLDYAIFKVSPVPPNFVEVDWSQKAPSGTKLTIFSHPQGRPLEWSQTCALQSPGTTQLSYQCDTEGGSSGATVLEDDTLKVTGIHWGGGGSANSATFILSTPIREFLQPDGGTGGTGGAGGADGGDAGGKAGAAGSAGKGGADGGDATSGDATTGDGTSGDASSDASGDATGDGAGGTAGAAGSAGASGSGGSAGMGGAAGTGGSGGKSGSGGGGTGGAAGSAGKAGAGGAGGATGGASGSGGATAGSGGTSGGAGGGSAGSSSGGKGGTGGSTGGTGSTPPSDDGGCSCRIGSPTPSTGDHFRSLLAAVAVGVIGLRRGRRKSERSSR